VAKKWFIAGLNKNEPGTIKFNKMIFNNFLYYFSPGTVEKNFTVSGIFFNGQPHLLCMLPRRPAVAGRFRSVILLAELL
jgi:hypothetical protein